MRKQTIKAVTMLISIVAFAFATALVSNAQSRRLTADVPFDFVVGERTLTAGQYSVGQITTGSDTGISVLSRDGRQNAVRLSNTVMTSSNTKHQARLIFRRYGSTYYLAQVWLGGSREGRELGKSKSEKAAEIELARNAAENNLAQNAKPEIVTIVAEGY
ncbi:MAG TPA: hypothetical protein VJT09_06515 [Pyrinomonadaceae bacterium]|nr:hypothetical protein [Pyrinomonadaceae bacterium]